MNAPSAGRDPAVAEDWPGVRLHVVTGKGGTGKSTVAAALALALAARGGDVLLCEVEGRQGIAKMFDVDPLPYAERRIARTGTGAVYALHIDAEAALLEYLSMYYRLGTAGRALDRFGVVEFATTIAPGVRDVLLTGKVYEAARRTRQHTVKSGLRQYDAVVLDAPPTGRITQFLGVNQELAGLARMGPIKTQADSVMTLIRSPRTAIHLVTLLEEMPVQETADAIAELAQADLPVGGIVVNLARDASVGVPVPRADKVRRELALAGIDDPDLAAPLVELGRAHAERVELEAEQRELVDALDRPTYELPRIAGGIDLGGLYELADRLRAQGMVP